MYIDYMKIFAKEEKEWNALIQTMRTYRQNIRMEFAMENCLMLIMKKRERETTEDIGEPN